MRPEHKMRWPRLLARYASFPLAANGNIDPTSLPAYHALARHLIANPR